MKANDYIKQFKIATFIAVGILAHLKIEGETIISENDFLKGYEEFTGKKLIPEKSNQPSAPILNNTDTAKVSNGEDSISDIGTSDLSPLGASSKNVENAVRSKEKK